MLFGLTLACGLIPLGVASPDEDVAIPYLVQMQMILNKCPETFLPKWGILLATVAYRKHPDILRGASISNFVT
jgi:hypothetical protein